MRHDSQASDRLNRNEFPQWRSCDLRRVALRSNRSELTQNKSDRKTTHVHAGLHLLANIYILFQPLLSTLLLVDLRPPKPIAQIHLFRKTRPHDLEQVPLDPADVCSGLQLLHDGQVLQGQVRVQRVPGEDLGVRVVVVVGAGERYRVGGGESGEESRIVQLAFGAHDSVRACGFEAGIDVGLVKNISVGEDWDGDCFLHGSNLVPVCEALKELT